MGWYLVAIDGLNYLGNAGVYTFVCEKTKNKKQPCSNEAQMYRTAVMIILCNTRRLYCTTIGKNKKKTGLVFCSAAFLAGFTMTLNAVYGLTQALHWTTKWDYFINLSASDLPLLPTVRHVERDA